MATLSQQIAEINQILDTIEPTLIDILTILKNNNNKNSDGNDRDGDTASRPN